LQVLDCLSQRLGFKYHALAAPEWPVVDGAMPIVGKLPQIVHRDFE